MHTPITIHARTTVGAFRALETLMQLATRDHQTGHIVIENVPLTIKDAPAYVYRGYMLDTSRHFMQPTTIKRQLEAMAMNKMNVFHWHISDAQSFPLASKATRLGEGAFSSREVYTKDDVLDIVRFARDRGIAIIPEFDMPGHAAAWGGGYPNLTVCNGWKHDPANGLDFKFNPRQYSGQSPAGQLDISKAETLDVVEALITEMAEWFPGSKYFHLGHDEINTNCYESAGLDTMDLLRKFQLHLEKVTAKLGLKKVLWQEPLTDPRFTGQINVSHDTVVQAWGIVFDGRNFCDMVVRQGYQCINSPTQVTYLDCGIGGEGAYCYASPSEGHEKENCCASHCGWSSWGRIYQFDPSEHLTLGEQAYVLGSEALLWTERVSDFAVDQLSWPRTAALAERLWANPKTQVLLAIHGDSLLMLSNGQSEMLSVSGRSAAAVETVRRP